MSTIENAKDTAEAAKYRLHTHAYVMDSNVTSVIKNKDKVLLSKRLPSTTIIK